MTIYDNGRLLAEKLINKFGAPATVYTPAQDGGEDPFGQPKPDVPRVDIDGVATGKLDYKNNEIDGTVILKGDCYILFHTDGEPKVGMYHDANGDTYRIINIMKLESRDNVVALIKLQLRR